MVRMQQLAAIEALEKIRALCMKHLSIGQSVIPYDILTVVFQAELNGSPITVKELLLKLPFSDMGIRYHLKRLIADDWIEITPVAGDKRRRIIKSKEKLIDQMNCLTSELNKIFPPPLEKFLQTGIEPVSN